MKILQVTNFFKPSWESGGPARVAYEISKKMVERGHEVTVYTTDGFKWKLNVEKNIPVDVNGIRTYYFTNLSRYLASERVFTTPYYLPINVRRNIRDFDIIHIHECNVLGVVVHYYAKKNGIPYVVQPHGSYNCCRSMFGRLWDLLFGHRVLSDATIAFALTKTEAEQYRRMGVDGGKIEIVPNGIDLSEYKELPKSGYFRRKYSIADDKKIVLYMGRLNKSKGIDLLINAFADLVKELNDVKLVLVGPDDGYRSAIEELVRALKVEDNVLFTGFITNEEKIAVFVDVDVFVTPSFSGFPVTFLEACACNTPIITTNDGDKLDWIERVGYVVEYNKDQLRDAISRILTDEKLKKKLGEEAGKQVEKKYNWDIIVEQILKVYEKIIQD